MNGSLLAASAALLSVLLWLATRRRPVPLLVSTSTEAVAALNRAQLTLVHEQARDLAASAAGSAQALPAPGDARGRQALLAQLQAQFAGDQRQRLAAMQLAHRWGDRATLPLLRLGLRDGDLAVRGEAAQAIARFRGHTAGAPAGAQLVLPRNVARTR
jgi:hypothetical protein